MTKAQREYYLYDHGYPVNARLFRLKGSTEIVRASCLKQALTKLVDEDGDFTYNSHWYTHSGRKSWASFETSWGYKGIIEEI